MGNDSVSFHFTDTQTPVIGTARHGLSRQCGAGSLRPVIDFVFHHMFQPHIIRGTHKNLRFNLLSRHTIVQYFVSTRMVSHFQQCFSKHFDFRSFVLERSGIGKPAVHNCRFSNNAFHQLSNGHTRWYCVWIDNEIWTNSVFGKRHIFFWNHQSDCSFLADPTRHFVAQIGDTFFPDPDFGNTESFFAFCHKSLVHHPELSFFRSFRFVHFDISPRIRRQSNQHRLVCYRRVFTNQSVFIQLTIIVSRFGSDDIGR